MSRFTTAAQVLRLLAGSDEPIVVDRADPIRDVLLTAAEACDRFGEADEAQAKALQVAGELRGLLGRVADLLSTQPLPAEGGAWPVFTLAADIRRALDKADHS